MTTESLGATDTKHFLGGELSYELVMQPGIEQLQVYDNVRNPSLSSHLLQSAPGIDIGPEVRQLQYLNPREVRMFLYNPRDEWFKHIANYSNPFGNAIRANIFFERAKLSRGSGEWLHKLVDISYQ
jgi:hypothetical protein